MKKFEVENHESSYLPEGEWELVWADEFDGDEIESEKVKNEMLHALAVFEYIVGQKWTAIANAQDDEDTDDTNN